MTTRNTNTTVRITRVAKRCWNAAGVLALVAASGCGSERAATPTTLPPAVVTSAGASAPDTVSASISAAVVASVVSNALGAGLVLDPECVVGVVAKLSDDDLAVLAASVNDHSGAQPTLSPEGDALADELDVCVKDLQIGTSDVSAGASATEDICSGVDRAAIAPLANGLDEGSNGRVVGPYGTASACRFEGDAGFRVTVTLTRRADLAAWDDEINDGDGVGDGTPQRGIGQAAAVGVGFADAVRGDDLIEVSVFPPSGVSAVILVQALSDVVDAFPF